MEAIEPDERAFAIVILIPRPAREGLGSARGDDRVERRVVDRTPAPPRHRAVMGRAARPLRKRHVLGLPPRARGEAAVPEAGLPFLPPQQLFLHPTEALRHPHPGRAPIFAVPA